MEGAFGSEIDYALMIKLYGDDNPKCQRNPDTRYTPPPCIGTRTVCITGNPSWHDVSTSHVERANLTMRMSMRRFTRLTNAFSKKVDNHKAAPALYFMHYNFARIHKALRVTPAMEAAVLDHVWELSDVALLAA